MSIDLNNYKKLRKEFYKQPVLKSAPKLLGKLFVKNCNGIFLSGMITEVEAYDGNIDEAAHTFNGETERTRVMFYEGGYLYVYFTYGMYNCCNIVFGKKGSGEAALIRSIEPLGGISEMMKNRSVKKPQPVGNLTTGPGKICMAYNIDKTYNGSDLCGDEIFLCDYKNIPETKIVLTERIGISKSQELMWRFYIKDNPFVSRK